MHHVDCVTFQRYCPNDVPVSLVLQGSEHVGVQLYLCSLQKPGGARHSKLFPTDLWSYPGEKGFQTRYSTDHMPLTEFVGRWKRIPWKKKCTT